MMNELNLIVDKLVDMKLVNESNNFQEYNSKYKHSHEGKCLYLKTYEFKSLKKLLTK